MDDDKIASSIEPLGRTIPEINEAVAKIRLLNDIAASFSVPEVVDEKVKLQKEWMNRIAVYQRVRVSSDEEEQQGRLDSKG